MAITTEMLTKVKALETEVVAAIRSGDLASYIHRALRKDQTDYELSLVFHALFAQSGISGGTKRVAQTSGMLRDIAASMGMGEKVENMILQVSSELSSHIMHGAYASVATMCKSLDVPVPVFMYDAAEGKPEDAPEWANQTVGGVH